MPLHTELPIYKKGCELLQLAYEVQQQMPRSFKRSLGEKITQACTDMLQFMALANATRGQERAHHIRQLLAQVHVTTVNLRVAHDMRFISRGLWARSMPLLDSLGKQGGGWLKSSGSMQPAPAA